MRREHEAGHAAFKDAQKQVDVILGKLKTKTASIADIQTDIDKKKLEVLRARMHQRTRCTVPIEQAARQKVAELKSILDIEKSHGSVLKAILQAKESNRIEGIYGRMGDLGAIDAKYDVAISTACPGLDYIVVETTGVAQACVELLRRENLGVATFMILATRIAYGGNKEFRRVVTLDGALFETSGTMSSGGSKPRGGKKGTSIQASSVSGEAVANAEKELSLMVENLNSIRQRIAEAVWEYDALETIFQRIDSLNSQHSYIEKQLDSLEAASQPRKDELDRLEELKKIISTEEKEIVKFIQGSKELKEKALELQNNIENAGGERLKAQKLKVNNIQSVDTEYKLQDMKKAYKELELKAKGYKKRLDDLQTALIKHMKDLVDPEKLQATLTDETLNEACDLKRALEMVALLEAQLKEMNPNLYSISEYQTKVSLYNERVEELNKVTQQHDDIKRRLDEFMAGFNAISLKLKEMYQMITLGGDAELALVDSLDPFPEGVVFSVRPPKKSWKNIANLSGGEKTLSSLALVFALHHYKPTSLYVMDEIDAALGTYLNPRL
uniref:SMC hinge domain-containing protein n=1 Tax=Quercus lobata TaxID=97700 RepID=A0A7N2MVZ9_QUELO